jgi:glutamate carboxypeptidase
MGRAAHAGLEPEKGASAVLEIARQIERVHGLSDISNGTTINVGVVEGGTRSNVVAAHARAEIDVRFGRAEEARRIEDAILSTQPFDERVKLIVRGGINRPPLERNDGVAGLYEHARAIAAALDFKLGEASVGGASDGNFIAAMNVPVLDGLGIDGDGAHAEHEHIITTDIALRGALLTGLIATL